MPRYRVTWEPIWHRGLDFLVPGQGSGSRLCATKKDAESFIAKLRHEGVRVGSEAGEEVFGNELKITWTEEK